MSSAEFSPTKDGIIRGQYTDIVLQNDANELGDYLDDSYGPNTLYRMLPEGLHYPVKYASLEFHKNDADDLSLFANTSFDAMVVYSQKIKNWQKFLGNHIKELLGMNNYEIYELPHKQYDFYVKLNDIHAAQIQFGADTHDCSVILSTEPLNELTYASEGKHRFDDSDSDDDPQVPEHATVLRDFAVLWSYIIDTITEELGQVELEDRQRPQIVLSVPTSAEQSDDTPEEDENDEEPEEIEEYAIYDAPPAIEMVHSGDGGFNLVGGLTSAKEQLQDIADLFRDPVGSYMYGVNPRHFVLHGPPGTGKTSLVKALAYELGATLETIKSSAIVSKWVGESGQNLDATFAELKSRPGNELIVLFFDEFEALGGAGRLGTQERVDVKKLLNQAIDDISKNHKNILIAAATNADIQDLEPSLIRPGRIEPIGAGNPNEHERIDIWAAVLTRSIASFGGIDDIDQYSANNKITPVFVPYSEDLDPVALAAHTDGYNGAHFEEMLSRARMKKFRHYRKTHEMEIVTQADLLHEITTFGR